MSRLCTSYEQAVERSQSYSLGGGQTDSSIFKEGGAELPPCHAEGANNGVPELSQGEHLTECGPALEPCGNL